MGGKKTTKIEKGKSTALYIPKDTPDHIIEYLNSFENFSKCMLELVGNALNSQSHNKDNSAIMKELIEIKKLLREGFTHHG